MSFWPLNKVICQLQLMRLNFYALFCYATQLVSIEDEMICLYVKGLIIILHILSIYMISVGRGFNKVIDYVKKIVGIQHVGQTNS